MLSVFIDTLLICTATAFMCLSSGVSFNTEMGGTAYVQTSMAENLGAFGPIFLSAAMSLFAFTTLIGNYSYCEGCLILVLTKPALLCLEDYCKQKKEGKNPVFVAKDAGIDADLDFWK